MMKITFCAYDKPDSIGGPVTWLMNLLPYLKDREMEVHCLILYHMGGTGPLFEHLTLKGVVCKTSPFLSYTEENIHWILQQIKDNPPDIFVPNLVVPAYYAARWAKEAGIFTVGVSHSDDPFYHAIQEQFIDGPAEFRLSGMVCVSHELERQLKASPRSHELDIARIPYGVDIPEGKSERKDDILRIAYVGRLAEEQKRISEVTRAFCRVTREVQNIEAFIYGDGPDRSNVEKILADEGQGLPVKLMGAIPNDLMQEHLLNCHVIVLLSDFEGLPIAVMEAMACGVVPVCLDMRSGITEQIEHGVTGLIVKNRDQDFTGAIEILVNDVQGWNEMSVNAKKLIQQSFSKDRSHKLWERYLTEIEITPGHVVSIPNKISLLPVHPHLARADHRMPPPPGFRKKLYLGIRKKAGMVKRKLFDRQSQ